jgi:hypothetical protein
MRSVISLRDRMASPRWHAVRGDPVHELEREPLGVLAWRKPLGDQRLDEPHADEVHDAEVRELDLSLARPVERRPGTSRTSSLQ